MYYLTKYATTTGISVVDIGKPIKGFFGTVSKIVREKDMVYVSFSSGYTVYFIFGLQIFDDKQKAKEVILEKIKKKEKTVGTLLTRLKRLREETLIF